VQHALDVAPLHPLRCHVAEHVEHEPLHRLRPVGLRALEAADEGRLAGPVVEPGGPGEPAKINPGEAGGWLTGRATCAVLDLGTLEAELCEIQ
jgi:hypothetical protein